MITNMLALLARDIGVKACHVPAEFKSKHPRAIRVESTGDYVAYELDMCYILAGSPQKHEALNNAQSNTGLIMFLYRLYENRDIDISTGIAKRR